MGVVRHEGHTKLRSASPRPQSSFFPELDPLASFALSVKQWG